MSARYLTLWVYGGNNNIKSNPIIKCIVRLHSDRIRYSKLKNVIRDAIEREDPNFCYLNSDIRSVKSKSGISLPLNMINDSAFLLEHLFDEGEAWHLEIRIIRQETNNARGGDRQNKRTSLLLQHLALTIFIALVNILWYHHAHLKDMFSHQVDNVTFVPPRDDVPPSPEVALNISKYAIDDDLIKWRLRTFEHQTHQEKSHALPHFYSHIPKTGGYYAFRILQQIIGQAPEYSA